MKTCLSGQFQRQSFRFSLNVLQGTPRFDPQLFLEIASPKQVLDNVMASL